MPTAGQNNNNFGTLAPGVSDSDESDETGGRNPTTTASSERDDGAFATFFRRNGAQSSHSLYTLAMVPFVIFANSLINLM